MAWYFGLYSAMELYEAKAEWEAECKSAKINHIRKAKPTQKLKAGTRKRIISKGNDKQ